MLVYYIYGLPLNITVCNKGHIRILRLDCIIEILITLGVYLKLKICFVAEFDVLHIKRLGMPQLCTDLAPFGISVAICKFYGIQNIVYPEFPVLVRSVGHSYATYIKGLCTEVFAKEQEFIVSESVCRAVSPEVIVSCSFLFAVECIFPIECLC